MQNASILSANPAPHGLREPALRGETRMHVPYAGATHATKTLLIVHTTTGGTRQMVEAAAVYAQAGDSGWQYGSCLHPRGPVADVLAADGYLVCHA